MAFAFAASPLKPRRSRVGAFAFADPQSFTGTITGDSAMP
jgi:hypothetical protein